MRQAPEMRGGLASAWQTLASPWTSVALCAWATAAAVAHLLAPEAGGGVGAAVLQIPLVALPFAAAAFAWDRGRNALPALLWAGGVALAAWGATQTGSAAGTLKLGEGAGPVETYDRELGQGTVPVHLGGILVAQQTPEGLAVRLGTGEHEIGHGVVPHDGREVVVGPWALSRQRDGAPAAPTAARLTLRSRVDPNAAPVTLVVPEGSARMVAEGVRVEVPRLSADFGRALGPAAQITLTWGDKQALTAWHFVGAPDLDARLGTAPWVITLDAVEATPAVVLGVRRRGPLAPLNAGLGLMALGLLLGLVRRPA